ncbi:MAG: DUF4399 domain-containing protein [Pseudomonadota bacterium]
MNTLRKALIPALAMTMALAACSKDDATPVVETEAPSAPAAPVGLPRSDAADGARVFFITPADGDTVTSPVTLEFGLEGMNVVPAGTEAPHSGHHHLLVDTGMPALDLPIPADANHIHFGDGSTSTTLELAPGEHTLQLLLGDHLHIPHEPPVASETITVTVE